MTEAVHYEETGAVATITIDNSSKRNAIGPPITEQIIERFEALDGRDNIRTVVLTGAGEKAFSAGGDMTYFRDEESRERARKLFSEMIGRVKAYDYPTIAMINGGTFGGAVHLISACDLRVAVEDAQFGITPAKIGRIYGDDSIHDVMALVGPANVKELLFAATFVDAQRAKEMGLLNHVVPRDELESKTYELAEQISNNAPLSLVGMKKVIRALLDHGTLTDAEQEWVTEMRTEAENSYDHEEGVEAFMEKRDPEFERR